MPSRAQLRAHYNGDKPIAMGAHYTLYYKCVQSKEEFYSSVDEIVQWISTGPLLQPPTADPRPHLHITTPSYDHNEQSGVSSTEPPNLPVPELREHAQWPNRLREDAGISPQSKEIGHQTHSMGLMLTKRHLSVAHLIKGPKRDQNGPPNKGTKKGPKRDQKGTKTDHPTQETKRDQKGTKKGPKQFAESQRGNVCRVTCFDLHTMGRCMPSKS
jgi:hypothetical protein